MCKNLSENQLSLTVIIYVLETMCQSSVEVISEFEMYFVKSMCFGNKRNLTKKVHFAPVSSFPPELWFNVIDNL